MASVSPRRDKQASQTRGELPSDAISSNQSAKWMAWIEAHPLLILALLTSAMLLPWVTKAFHIDDPMFIWAGAHILNFSATDFYGFQVTWTAHEAPMHQLMQNPPLACYYIALAGWLAGINEISLHVAFFVPAVLMVIGTWRLAREHCRWPALAAALVAIMPVFVICGTTIAADVMMACCWVWTVHFWDQGLKRQSWKNAMIAGALAGLAFLAKYPAMNLLPLLIAYAVFRRSSLKYVIALAIPIVVMVAYDLVTARMYGNGLLSEAFSYAQQVRLIRGADPVHKAFVALCFTGACMAPALFLAPLLWSNRGLLAGAAIFAAVMIGLPLLAPPQLPQLLEKQGWNWPLIGQIALWATAGSSIVGLCIVDLVRRRDASAVLMALWTLGTIAFAGAMNWSVNGRTLLPMAPPVAILIVRQLEARGMMARRDSARALPVALSLAILLAVAVSWADFTLARASRRAVDQVFARYGSDASRIWFQGHWGFQYYMQMRGARPLLLGKSLIKRGDHIVIPKFSTNVLIVEEPLMSVVDELAEPDCRWLSTMNHPVGAAFYSDAAGPLPFAFGRIPAERFVVQRVNISQSPK